MSNLTDAIKESKAVKGELAASTIRIPRGLNSFIEELADQLTRSKQEVMLMLLEEGAEVAEKAMNTDEGAESGGFHILNTNRRHDVNDHEEMISKGIAAAFYDPWKYNIDRIQDGDTVFLYENGVGIVAYGTGTGETLKKEKYGDEDECHYQKLQDFHTLQKPISASEIKNILGRHVVFLRTMAGMPDGQKILDVITGR